MKDRKINFPKVTQLQICAAVMITKGSNVGEILLFNIKCLSYILKL
jgi:hypothetical protein